MAYVSLSDVICPSTAEGFKCQLSQSRYKVGVMPSIYFIVWNSTKIIANASNGMMLLFSIVSVPIFRICYCIVKMKKTSWHHQLLVPNFHWMLLVTASHILYIPTCSTAPFPFISCDTRRYSGRSMVSMSVINFLINY